MSDPLKMGALNNAVPSNMAGPPGDVDGLMVWLVVEVREGVCVCVAEDVDDAVVACEMVCETD